MKDQFPIRVQAIGIYLFCAFIAFLGGAYFDPIILALFIVLILFPLLSIALFLASYFNLKFTQNFSTEHPMKGEIVKYKIVFANELSFPFPFVHIKFMAITPEQAYTLPEYSVYIKRKGEFTEEFEIQCPYRGIYNVGLEQVIVRDMLHFFQLKLKVWHKTFYVYPRILLLQRFFPGLEDVEGGEKGLPYGGNPDYSMFDQLKEYRPGETIKHIYWKKFAIMGRPVLKEFDTTPQPAVCLYFDLRKPVEKNVEELEIEDTSVEILVAMTKFFLDHDIKTVVRTGGREMYSFEGKEASDFNTFYNSTSSLMFQDTFSITQVYSSDEKRKQMEAHAVFFVTHILDLELFNLIQASINTDLSYTVIFNQSGFTSEQRQRNEDFFYSLRNQGATIIPVNSSKTIIEDLEREFHE
ncbi:MAG: DUF58 domain-containing protein [Spirochaetales bacterium]|nr:DUF58 domain-containing protein [Spirochaetales bacterium]